MVGHRRGRRHTALWTVVALAALWAYLRVVGVDAVVTALGRVTLRDATTLVGLGAVPILLWGVSLHLVLARLDVSTTLPRSVGLFAAAGFLNNVTPFGQAGGDPVSGALVARVGGTAFERGLAAVVSVSAANAVGLAGLGAVGLGVVGVAAAGGVPTVAAGVGLTAAVGAGALLAWRVRARLVGVVGDAVGGLVVRIGSVIPGVDPPERAAVARRVRAFVAALERVADDRRRLVAVLGLGVAGHLAVATTLWVALVALDAVVAPATVLVVVPVARLAGASPTPGGAASAEALVTGLLVTIGGVAAPVAAAAALVYRAAAFWLPTLGGGVVTVGLLVASGATDYDSRR
ncbi:MAG: lysylphosphatidylglycerol synthase transmembrane domain-containing protein [Haloplanus sp.]